MKRLFFLFFCLAPALLFAQNNPDKQLLDSLTKSIEKKAEVLQAEFNAATRAQKNDENFVRSMNEKYALVLTEYRQVLRDFISAHPDSETSLLAFGSLMQSDFDVKELQTLYDTMTDEIKNSGTGKQLSAHFLAFRRTAIGAKAPDFAQNDPEGNPIKLSDFRGKYLLLDFWASWCGPCRKENPHIVKAYEAVKGKNFEILGISLDNSKSTWTYAIEKDQLTWPQVSDTKGWKNEVAVLYGVQSIPQNYLLDPNGIIIAKNLRGEELVRKLNEILK